jgi:hypothetical protein
MIVTPNSSANRTSFWAKFGMTVCFLTASVVLVSGLARGHAAVPGGDTTRTVIIANR